MTMLYSAELLHRAHPVLRHHRPMSPQGRAAQFSAFAALTGFDEEIDETARLTDAQEELTEEAFDRLNAVLVHLAETEAQRPLVTVTYFRPDSRKSGGAYLTYSGRLRFLDEAELKLHFTDGTVIPIPAVSSISEVP